jgi:hypothetical protein
MFHVLGLGYLNKRGVKIRQHILKHPNLSVGAVTLYIASLHALEASLWAWMFVLLAAVPARQTAMLYSLNALTAFGHTDIALERKWQLMGAMESLNGWILFSLSAAYLFVLIQLIWSHNPAQTVERSPVRFMTMLRQLVRL